MRKILAITILSLLMAALLYSPAQEKPVRTEAEQKAIAKAQQLGGLVLELAQNDPRLFHCLVRLH